MLRFLLAFLLLATPALADVTVTPGQRTSFSVSGTITTGNTFQTLMAADPNRTGCIIQNTGTHTMYVYFGATANATTSNSLQVVAGGSIYCSASGVLGLTDNVAITTSTSTDPFVAFYQH